MQFKKKDLHLIQGCW